MDEGLQEIIQTVTEFAAKSNHDYLETKEWTNSGDSSCMTIRVPVALLHRIRDLHDEYKRVKQDGRAISA